MSVFMQMPFSARVRTLLITIVWFSLSNFLLVCNGLESDISCLKSIKDSMEDPLNYLSSSWNFNNATEGFICKFTGVECWHPEKNKVLNIRLSDMGHRGQFPRGLANCTSLTGSDLSRNFLSGPIPSDISKLLRYVTSLDLSSNNFSGEIPPEIANISFLNALKLDSNQLTGKIPPVLGQLGRIRNFNVSNNHLLGPVPSFVNFKVLAESYSNNSGLCGCPLPPCTASKKNNHAFFIKFFVIAFSLSAVLVFALTVFYLKMIKGSWKNKRSKGVVVQGSECPTTNNRSKESKVDSVSV